MRLVKNGGGWPHAVALVWAIMGMLVAPLVHIHPEADHHHGEVGHAHGGTIHMVFSPDLDGEFEDHHHPTDGFGHSTSIPDAISDHSSDVVGFAEIEVTFLNDSTEQKLPKPIGLSLLAVEPLAIIVSAQTPSIVPRAETPSCHAFSTRDIPSRAPPSLSV
jgi:hypothetical protein